MSYTTTTDMILLVEQDVVARGTISQLLRESGYDVVEAADGTEALECLKNCRFDLVITDLVLPKVNGLKLVDNIRETWPNLPVIVVSGYLAEDIGKFLLCGSAQFFQTPIKRDVLIETVRSLISRPR